MALERNGAILPALIDALEVKQFPLDTANSRFYDMFLQNHLNDFLPAFCRPTMFDSMRVSVVAAQAFFPVDGHPHNQLLPDFYDFISVVSDLYRKPLNLYE